METIVYKDVKESPFKMEFADICFHFSSLFNLTRFQKNVENYVSEEELKVRNKYQLEIDLKKYLAIALYKKIEKRGFYVKLDDEELNYLNFKNIIEIRR